MKVLSFLEFFGLTPQEKRDYLDSIGLISKNDYKDRWSCNDSELFFSDVYYEEVSIEFKPELITELFEGWEKSSQYHYYNKDISLEISFLEPESGQARPSYARYSIYATELYKGDILKIDCFLPRTLEDFIRDCERAGIELIRRQK